MPTIWNAFAQGVLADRPAAANANRGFFYLATDQNGGTFYQSNGVLWIQAAAPVAVAPLVALDRSGWAVGSSSGTGGHPETDAIDGDPATYYTTTVGQDVERLFTVDLGVPQTFSRVMLDCTIVPDDFPRDLAVDVSSNDVTYTTVYSALGASTITVADFALQTARYVHLRVQGRTGWGGPWSIAELNIYGPAS